MSPEELFLLITIRKCIRIRSISQKLMQADRQTKVVAIYTLPVKTYEA